MINRKLFLGLWAVLLLLIIFSYRNHFDNGFEFDDGHTIQNNIYIQSLKNIPKFFVDGAETFSTLPANQLYRPFVSTTIAIDYWLSSVFDKNSNGFNPVYYHISMFVEYLVMLWLFYLIAVKIFDNSFKNDWNKWIALFATAWFGIHTVNAETLNYIISRSDLLSTFFVLASFVIFIYFPKKRKYGLFLIPFVLGMFTKLTTAMFGPLLLVYYILFEFDLNILRSKSGISKNIKLKKLLIQSSMIALLSIFGTMFIISMQADTYTTGGSSRWLYLITQPFVLFHYFISFFIPYNLSADTDWSIIDSALNWRFIVGISFIIAMLFVAFKSYKELKTRPITFGIMWFFFALAPTSSLIPFAEVLNDHRMMYPFVGLTFSVVWALALLFYKYFDVIMNSYWIKNVIIGLMCIIIIGHSFGVMSRVEVWDNGKNLWYDVTQKSPKNGRGLMNYGLQLMAESKYDEALTYFYKSGRLMPYYSYLYTNMAIAQNALDSVLKAEENYKKAINLAPNSYNGYYFYAIFLRDKKRNDEAVTQFLKVVELAPQFIFARYALLEQYLNNNQWSKLKNLVQESIKMFPDDRTINYYNNLYIGKINQTQSLEKEAVASGDVNKMIELSMIYYNSDNFEKSAQICKKIIEMHSDNIIAYNNLVATLNNLGKYSESLKYGNLGLKLEPDNQLLKNNLAVAQRRFDLKNQQIKGMTSDQIINLSLLFYNEGMYLDCARVCEELVKQKPNNALAYNNICSAYNALGEWEKAIKAGEMAIKLDPKFQLAKNNVALAKSNLQKK